MKKYHFIFFLVALLFWTCKTEEPDVSQDEELDPTDYTEDIAAIAEFYAQDPIRYYAENGLPFIVGAAINMEDAGLNRLDAFTGLWEHFDLNKAQEAINQQQWSNEFIQLMQQFIPADLQTQWAEAIIVIGSEVRDLQFEDPNDPQLGPLYMILGDAMNYAMVDGFFQEMMMDVNVLVNLPEDPTMNYMCTCDMLDPDDELENFYCDADDWEEEDIVYKWSEIKSVNRPRPKPTSKDGKCATLAAGLCLLKLKKIQDRVNDSIWLDLSMKLGAGTFKNGGASKDKVVAYFKTLGLGVMELKDIPNGKTASQQAHEYLKKKGCDVKMHYRRPAGVKPGKAHIEYVHDIVVDPDDPKKATVTTNHWGDNNTLKYNNGNFSDRSTGSTDRDAWLLEPGRATYWVFCPK